MGRQSEFEFRVVDKLTRVSPWEAHFRLIIKRTAGEPEGLWGHLLEFVSSYKDTRVHSPLRPLAVERKVSAYPQK